MIGIYKITNIINNKVYVGQSVELEERKREHFRCLRKGIHDNIYLQNAFNKYGESCFKFEIIEFVEDNTSLLTQREQYWIDYYGGYQSSTTYNLKEAGFHGHDSEELRLIKSRAQRGKKMPKLKEEHKRKISQSLTGIKRSVETRKKMSRPKAPRSKEHAKKIGDANRGRIPWNKGLKATEETRKKLSLAAKGHHRVSKEQYIQIAKKLEKPVAQYDIEGNLIKIWNSRKEVLASGQFSKNFALHDCIKGRIKTAGGYIWKDIDTKI